MPLDANMDKRVYLQGDPICRLPFEEPIIILNRRFIRQYSELTRVCLEKEARFRPLKAVQKKKQPQYKQLEIKSLTDTG